MREMLHVYFGEMDGIIPDAKAIAEYNEFNKHQKIDSDFDKEVRKMLKGDTE